MTHTANFPQTRMRRLRQTSELRELVRETHLRVDKLVLPLFIRHGHGVKKPIASMPGHFQLSLDMLEDEIAEIVQLGIKNIVLFGIPESKDDIGSIACEDHGIIQQAIKKIKALQPNMIIISDICLCEYTDHGHCGAMASDRFDVDNDKTIALLAQQAVSHAKAGADIIAPSANMDGMVHAIRHALDNANFQIIPILSYSAKYASSMYGPFREAAEGAPKKGDRSTYQMDYANGKEAIRECLLDIQEGADMLMVKPAHAFLDIIYRVKQAYPHYPLCAYHTSGEFAMIKAAAEKGWINEQKSMLEVTTAIYRAGADFIITYFAKDIAKMLG